MSSGPKVIVAGAGALGLASAVALADAGCAVTLYDPRPEANASAVAAGMLAPVFEAVLDPETTGAFDVLLAARDLWPALAARAGVELDRSGAMAVGDDAWLAGIEASLIRFGVHGIDLPRRAAQDLAPGLAEDVEHAVLVREDWRLEPLASLRALRRAAEAAGVVFRQEKVGQAEQSDWLVLATGPGAGLTAIAPEMSALSPIKGHILRVGGVLSGRVSLRGQGIYAVPGDDGLSIGATMEAGVDDPTPDPQRGPPLLQAAARLIPALNGRAYDLFAGVRATTPDGLPMVGFSAAPRTLVAAGARRNGWLLAPLVAQLVAACVTGREAGPYARRLDPARFGR